MTRLEPNSAPDAFTHITARALDAFTDLEKRAADHTPTKGLHMSVTLNTKDLITIVPLRVKGGFVQLQVMVRDVPELLSYIRNNQLDEVDLASMIRRFRRSGYERRKHPLYRRKLRTRRDWKTQVDPFASWLHFGIWVFPFWFERRKESRRTVDHHDGRFHIVNRRKRPGGRRVSKIQTGQPIPGIEEPGGGASRWDRGMGL